MARDKRIVTAGKMPRGVAKTGAKAPRAATKASLRSKQKKMTATAAVTTAEKKAHDASQPPRRHRPGSLRSYRKKLNALVKKTYKGGSEDIGNIVPKATSVRTLHQGLNSRVICPASQSAGVLRVSRKAMIALMQAAESCVMDVVGSAQHLIQCSKGITLQDSHVRAAIEIALKNCPQGWPVTIEMLHKELGVDLPLSIVKKTRNGKVVKVPKFIPLDPSLKDVFETYRHQNPLKSRHTKPEKSSS